MSGHSDENRIPAKALIWPRRRSRLRQWSTISGLRYPISAKVSGAKHVVSHFAAKNKIDEFIQSKPELLAKTTFFYITFHASNLHYPVFAPIKVESVGKYIWLLPCPKETPFFAIGIIA